MENQAMILVPNPKKIDFKNDLLFLKNKLNICIPQEDKDAMLFTANRLQQVLEKFLKIDAEVMAGKPYPDRQVIVFERDCRLEAEGYTIKINSQGINISSRDSAGAFHAVSTLKQIISQNEKKIPCLEITDEPDFKARGFMLDISRDKIPTLETLYKYVDLMSDLKLNQFQLYIEGFSFAYPSYPEVWKHETPITGEEFMKLDRYCRDRFIDLVPNQNNLSHMGSWLSRKEFEDMAEKPGGFELPWEAGTFHHAITMDPSDPRSLELVKNITGDLLPNFSSSFFNVCLDEAFELGLGKNKELCEKIGKDRVYLNYLLKVYEVVKKYGKRMMFWGDMIVPDLTGELPKDVIGLEWAYDCENTFEEAGQKFMDAGIPYYACPGTNSWTSFAGRTEMMIKNQQNASMNSKKNGAAGYLNTDWGDFGHHQYMPVSYTGLSYGAALCWNVENNLKMDIGGFLDKFVFMDSRGVAGKCFLELGDYYKKEPLPLINSTLMFKIFVSRLDDMRMMEGVDEEILDNIKNYIDKQVKLFDRSELQCGDARIVDAEFRNAARLISHLVDTARVKLLLKADHADKNCIKVLCEILIDDIECIVNEHRRLWLLRNKAGGLERSAEYFEKLKKQYKEIIES